MPVKNSSVIVYITTTYFKPDISSSVILPVLLCCMCTGQGWRRRLW